MGTYLSRPNVDKNSTSGVDLVSDVLTPVAWSASDMQGWRKHMEDSHITNTNVPPPAQAQSQAPAKIFAVFDGHGGREVALFVERHFVDLLTSDDAYNDNDVGEGLRRTFHNVDRMVDDLQNREEIMRLKEVGREGMIGQENGGVMRGHSTSFDGEGGLDPAPASSAVATRNHSINEAGSGSEDWKEKEKEKEKEKGETISASEAIDLFQKLLSMRQNGAADGEAAATLIGDSDSKKPAAITNDAAALLDPAPSAGAGAGGDAPARQVCNLADHPIHAGCTSVVACLVGRTLHVANAGDSRAVLCRKGGITEPLSYDHKPEQKREKDRIEAAGGFVNNFGRVNGNLNLSRSLGDLKYKQNKEVGEAEQMITAEPDLVKVELEEGDEFIVMGCDGIWDCLSNAEAVKYVRDRIDATPPKEIIEEMLDEIISDDPRRTQGIGGDNMTAIIIDLLPTTRTYAK